MATATVSRKKMSDNASEINASDVEAQIGQIREDIVALTKTVAAYGSGKAGKYAEQAEKTSMDLARSSQNALKTMRDEVKSVEQNLETQVRNKPLQAIGIAAGVGFLLAFMARR